MKFLADMGISRSTVKWLIDRGDDAIHVNDSGMHMASDLEIIVKARKENRVVLTLDLDFGDIMAVSGEKHPSVIIFRLENETPQNINKRLSQALEESMTALNEGAIVIVEDARHRVRLLG